MNRFLVFFSATLVIFSSLSTFAQCTIVRSINGPSQPCVGGDVTYTTEPGMTDYTWTAVGASIQSGQGTNMLTLRWTSAGIQTVSVVYTDTQGCRNDASPFALQVHVKRPTISGPSSVCNSGLNGHTYTTEPGMSNYVWTVYAGTIVSGGTSTSSSVTINWAPTPGRRVVVNYTTPDGCTGTSPGVQMVDFINTPTAILSGNTTACLNAGENAYTAPAGQTNYTWTVVGGTIKSGGTPSSNVTTVTWTSTTSASISVSYDQPNNCRTSTKTVNVMVKTVTPLITGSGQVCASTPPTATVSQYQTTNSQSNYIWTVSSGGIVIDGGSSTSSTIGIQWTTAGPQSVSVVYTTPDGCISNTATLSVMVNASSTPTISGRTSVCANPDDYTGASLPETYTTEPLNSSYQWSVVGGNLLNSGSPGNIASVKWYAGVGQRSISVKYLNQSYCQSPTKTLDVNFSAPVPTISGSMSVCKNSTHTYTTEGGKTNYIWTVPPNGTITAGGTNADNWVSIRWLGAPSFGSSSAIKIRYTDENLCSGVSASASGNVFVDDPYLTFSPANQTLCTSDQTYFYKVNGQLATYVWNVEGGTVTSGGLSANNFVYVKWLTPGNKKISVTGTTSTGCSVVTPIVLNLTVNPSPTVSITGPNALCSGNTTYTFSTDAGYQSYSWDLDGGTTSSSGPSVNGSWASAGTKNIKVSVFNGTCFSAPATKSIIVHASPAPVITGELTGCVDQTYTYTTTAGQSNYQWQFASGTLVAGGSAADNFATIKWNSLANFLSVGYTNNEGCSGVTTQNISLRPAQARTIQGSQTSCAGQSQLYTTETGKSNYQWSVVGGTITSGANTATATVVWNSDQTNSISVYYDDPQVCHPANPTTLAVTVAAIPVPSITGKSVGCINSQAVQYTTDTQKSDYNWTVTGGTITSGAQTNTAIVVWTSAGTQSITISYKNNNCTIAGASTKLITVGSPGVATISGSTAPCKNDEASFGTEAGMSNYQWITSADGSFASGATTANASVSWSSAGNKSLRVYYEDSNGCQISKEQIVTVKDRSAPTFSSSSLTACQGVSAYYATQWGPSNYSWTVIPDGTLVGGTNTAQITWNTPGIKTVSVNYNYPNTCPAILPTTMNVEVLPVSPATITGPMTICQQEPATYTTEANKENYEWIVNGGTITGSTSTNEVTVKWTVEGTGTIRVRYNHPNGCVVTETKQVTVRSRPEITITETNPPTCISSTETVYTTQAGMTNYNWSVSSGGTITAGGTSTDNFVKVIWRMAGENSIGVGYNNPNGCVSAPYSRSLYFYPQPTATIGSNMNCRGPGNIYYTESGASNYQWHVTGGNITSGGTTADRTVTIDWTSTGAKSVEVTYNNSRGCISSVAKVNPVITDPPVATISGAGTTCVNNAQALSYNTRNGMTDYHWQISSGTINGSTYTARAYFDQPGQQEVSVTFKDNNGCISNEARRIVQVYALPVPSITGPEGACVGTTAVYTTDTGMSNYDWRAFGGTGVANGNTYTVTWLATSNGRLTLKYKDANGCTNQTDAVKEVSVINPTLDGPGTACAQSDIIVTTQPGKSNYVWSYAGATLVSGGGSSDNTIMIKYMTPGTYNVTVTYDNCPNPVSKSIEINALPPGFSLTPAGPLNVCAGSYAYLSYAGAGQTQYEWIKDDVVFESSTDHTKYVNQTGVYSMRIKNTYGCYRYGNKVSVTMRPIPSAEITPNANYTICSNQNAPLSVASQPGSSYYWTNENSERVGTSAPSYLPTATGTYKVQVTDQYYCSATSTAVTVTVKSAPSVSIASNTPQPVCAGAVTLFANVAGGSSGIAFQWKKYGLTISGATANSYRATETGIYKVTATNASGCSSTSNEVQLDISALPTMTVTGPSAFCEGGSVALWTSSLPGNVVSYVWDNGSTSDVRSVTVPGTYSVTATDQFGCTRTISKTVTMNTSEGGAYVTASPRSCLNFDGDRITLSAFPSDGINYVWSDGQTGQTIETRNGGNITVSFKTATGLKRGCFDVGLCYFRTKTPTAEPEPEPEKEAYTEEESIKALYPNPADKMMTVKLPNASGAITVQFANVSGVIVQSYSLNASDMDNGIDTSSIPNGIYTVNIRQGHTVLYQSKIVIAH